ncbi:MAG: 16S rRNA (cytosine(1402)-N(4))-methyltransferase RsmH [SAR202 cluster bacterium]|nr:16S rRNA (cytosine(1402)-N(4))-methyltransferase RsmH [SAR202 cluster bacterium]
MDIVHRPVMVAEVLEGLQVKPGGFYIDGTLGEGGHTEAILEAATPPPTVMGTDLDTQAIAKAAKRLERFGERAVLVHGTYVDMGRLAQERGLGAADGVLMDLGLSSLQLETPERGFSFARPGPLDMRFDNTKGRSAHQLVNGASERDLADIIFRFGEEPRSRKIARSIVSARPVETTADLVKAVERVMGRPRPGQVHPATRTFQAIRIAINKELENVENGLVEAVNVLKPGGRLVVISYHSLEDRLAKTFFAQESRDCICPPEVPVCVCGHKASIRVLTRKVITPTEKEIEENPRSRSARIRIAERL